MARTPRPAGPTRVEEGLATWYGEPHHGRPTANGEVFDMWDRTAAHRTLPFGARVRVTDLDSGRSVVVRINDRGPAKARFLIDVSRGAAEELGMVRRGVARVRIEVLGSP